MPKGIDRLGNRKIAQEMSKPTIQWLQIALSYFSAFPGKKRRKIEKGRAKHAKNVITYACFANQ